jgi:hypothetical protein
MSDNADRSAREPGGVDPNVPFNLEDVDTLLADVEALTSKVESEIGLPDADLDAVADRIGDDVLAIEQSVAASAAEAADLLRDDRTLRPRRPRRDGRPGDRG